MSSQASTDLEALHYCWAGCMDYETAYRWQLSLARARAEKRVGDCLVLLTHPPVYTTGTRTLPEHLPSAETLQRHGARLFQSDRGGSITYHGPGQLVGYGIVDLVLLQYDVHRYVRLLEEAILCVLRDLGVAGERHATQTGIWVGQAKIASIGIKIVRRVTMHGFALNLRNSLSAMRDIVPCGIVGGEVTSLTELGMAPPPECEVADRVASHLGLLLGYADWRRCDVKELLKK
jgi:lipoyl(octanoyl) transferase